MELEETLYRLELLLEDRIAAPDDAYVEWLWDEARQRIAIFVSIIYKKGERRESG
jgi:hypothetical protein